MAQVQKQLIASQKFLVGLTALPQYGEHRGKQLERLLTLIGKSQLSLEQSGAAMDSLDPTIWDEESLSRLKSVIADRTASDDAEESKAEKRAKQHNYSALPHYLDSSWWRRLETAVEIEKEKNLELLCQLAARLGLSNPTEETYAFLYAMSFALHPGCMIFDCDKLTLPTKWKPVMKRHLRGAPTALVQLRVLPEDVGECPNELLRAAYPDGFSAAMPVHTTFAEVMRLGRTWPLRTTNVAATASKGLSVANVGSLPLAGGNVIQAVAAATAHAVTSQLVGKDPRTSEPELPGFKMLAPRRDEMSKVAPAKQLALMDQEKDAPSSDNSTAEKMIVALRADLEKEKEQPAKLEKASQQNKKKKKN
eukprot:s36_g18.t1